MVDSFLNLLFLVPLVLDIWLSLSDAQPYSISWGIAVKMT